MDVNFDEFKDSVVPAVKRLPACPSNVTEQRLSGGGLPSDDVCDQANSSGL